MRNTWVILLTGLFSFVVAVARAANEALPDEVTTRARIPLETSVDPRVELFSVMFRLAGHPEYNRAIVKSYARAVDHHFGPYRDHPVIHHIRELRRSRGVSFDAPMSLCVHLTAPDELKPRIPLSPRPAGLDGRWPADVLPKFLEEARDFCRKSKFNEFMAQHAGLYAFTLERLQESLQTEAHLEWFDRFFGARPGADFKLVVALLNGPNSYGARITVDGREELYCMLGVWRMDWQGKPAFDQSMIATVIHEFCHSYVNPLVYAHTAQLETSGKALFARVQNRMKRMAYGNWQTMIHESVVRASVIRHTLRYRGLPAGTARTAEEINRGFLWMAELVELLERYEKQRDTYTNFEAFFPEVIKFFDNYAARMGD